MFYCKKCGDDREWPEGFFKSYGRCEICGKSAPCSDVQSKLLPLPKRMKTNCSKIETVEVKT